MYADVLSELRATFETDVTKPLKWRKDVLRSYIRMFKENHQEIVDAVIEDLGGGEVRPLVEFAMIAEAEDAIANLDRWAADINAATGDPLQEVPLLDTRVIRPTPKGVVLILVRWHHELASHHELKSARIAVRAGHSDSVDRPHPIALAVGLELQSLALSAAADWRHRRRQLRSHQAI